MKAPATINNDQLYNIHGGSHHDVLPEAIHSYHMYKEFFNDLVDFYYETPGEGDHAMQLLVKGKQWLSSWIE